MRHHRHPCSSCQAVPPPTVRRFAHAVITTAAAAFASTATSAPPFRPNMTREPSVAPR
eukprot:CAMPEP_0198425818 /NCGR_PEP_ID=MMETSP1452-20131203/4828_1 /TAXON_ID=1181717 /ORGANISM="Synchroma pusillum, Strain CCMP3072" /LENGTH=57 /DNA_ID=CAMNT_0044146181 /DNA_START=158 /DNA_END=328 /DNA_ORIENTATION=+